MLKKILLTSCLLFTSLASKAALISHYGYERDSSSNIVKGGGLEWLMWDVTKGLSINSALQIYSSDGWKLATTENMVGLFNTFEFGKNNWSVDSEESQFSVTPWVSSEDSSHTKFINLFGSTQYRSCITDNLQYNCYLPEDPLNFSSAVYGGDGSNKLFNISWLWDDASFKLDDAQTLHLQWTQAFMSPRVHPSTYYSNFSGVALVRVSELNPVPVSLPDSISFLALGIAVLGLRRRQSLDGLTS